MTLNVLFGSKRGCICTHTLKITILHNRRSGNQRLYHFNRWTGIPLRSILSWLYLAFWSL